MSNYQKSLKVLLMRLLIVLALYQFSRVLFYWNNGFVFEEAGIMEFLGGMRFDLSAIVYTNALVIFGHVIPGNFKYNKIYQTTLKLLFYVVNLLFLATNFIDIEYFKFTSRRSTYSLITASGMEGDILRLIPVFAKSYWWIFLGFIVLSVVFWKLIPNVRFNKEAFSTKPTRKQQFLPYVFLVLSMAMILVVGRGGLQRNPLKIVDAIRYANTPNNTPLVLNTPFSILKTISKKDNLKEIQYYSEEEIRQIYQPIITLDNEEAFQKKNIVLIILESFGEENLFLEFEGKKLTPVMDSLVTSSVYFNHAYANGRKSIDAVPSTILSIPSLMEISYISSPYSFNQVDGFNKVLKEKNYTTAFYHGAFNGSQNFFQFSSIASFDHYYGKDEYDREGDEDGVWGIYDEEFLQFSVRQMNETPQPFFSTIFTISSHNPYRVPDKYKGHFPKGNRTIHESIAYADHALGKFFEAAKQTPWYKNTLFVITADHTSGDDKREAYYLNPVGTYKIPILLIDVAHEDDHRTEEKLMAQIDLLPEILHYLNHSGEIFSFGNDPLKKNNRTVANYNEGLYHFILDNYYVCFDGKKIIQVNDIDQDKLLEHDLSDYPKALFEERMKAYIQQFNNRVIRNKTIIESIEKGINHTK